jgi:integrative and conjugative element protein (TIGR02256 family)
MTEDLEFWSEDRAFGLRIPAEILSRVLELSRGAASKETGGILVGFYTEAQDCAVVTKASGAPSDSKSRKASFVRGTAGLQRWLDKLWRQERRHYLGEWHFHPDAEPVPSPTDEAQIKAIANADTWKCPEPVLLIVGAAAYSFSDVRVYVFPRAYDALVILLREESQSAP